MSIGEWLQTRPGRSSDFKWYLELPLEAVWLRRRNHQTKKQTLRELADFAEWAVWSGWRGSQVTHHAAAPPYCQGNNYLRSSRLKHCQTFLCRCTSSPNHCAHLQATNSSWHRSYSSSTSSDDRFYNSELTDPKTSRCTEYCGPRIQILLCQWLRFCF